MIQAMRNEPAPWSPPDWAAMRGNRQMLPVPTAMPMALRINPSREEKRWFTLESSCLFMGCCCYCNDNDYYGNFSFGSSYFCFCNLHFVNCKMRNKKPFTPFPTTGYYGPAFFCDREEESRKLISHIMSGQSTTLAAIRRLGKTALIRHVQQKMKPEWIPVYADILPTENADDLLKYLATSIIQAIPEKSRQGKKIWALIKSLRPVISYDSYSGMPNLSFSLRPDESRQPLQELLSLMEQGDKPVLFAIDEFQQILNYPEPNVDAWLRKIIQELKNVVFIYCGSQQHLMNDLFTNPSRPFFRSTLFQQLDKIPSEIYAKFITEQFYKHGRKIPFESVDEILAWTDVHTYYVQLVCNRVFANIPGNVPEKAWKGEALKLLKEQEYVFFGYREVLTQAQWHLLKAAALEGKLYAPTSKDFIGRYQLGSPATVLRSIDSLLRKELLFKNFDKQGTTYYGVYDILFRRWIETI